MAKRRSKKESSPFYLHNVYAEEHTAGKIDFYKQGGIATDYFLKEGSWGLSYHAEKLMKGLLGRLTSQHFSPLSEDSLPPEYPLQKREVMYRDHFKDIPHVPSLRFESKGDIVRLMKGSEDISPRDYEIFDSAIEELRSNIERKWTETVETTEGKRQKKTITAEFPLFNIGKFTYTKEEQEKEGSQQTLFEASFYVCSVAHPFLLKGIWEDSSQRNNYIMLPIDNRKLLSSEDIKKREELLLNYLITYYNRVPAHYFTQPGKNKKVFQEEELLHSIMGLEKEVIYGTNREVC
ncbi:MAG: hypothetical protein FJ333_09175, partial [Sphingomonadales bacterium]|nr:hypothetical protein [Sphingomonadales bacterium]